jgi:hypothetical protein
MGAARALTPAVVALCVALAATAQGQVYTWTDENGDEHFSDNLLSVPAKHRQQFSKELARQEAERRAAEARAAAEKARQDEDEYRFGHLRPKKAAPDPPAAAPVPVSANVAAPAKAPGPPAPPAPAAVTPESIAAARKHRDLNIPHIQRIIEDLKEGLVEKTALLKKADGTGPITVPMDPRDLARLRSAVARIKGEIQYWEHQLKELDKPVPEYADPPQSP